MSYGEHLEQFHGLRVVTYQPESDQPPADTPVAHRVTAWSFDEDGDGEVNDDSFHDVFDAFLNDPRVGLVEALIIGPWEYEKMCDGLGEGGSAHVVEALVAARERLAGLKALFLGDIISTECELSWIAQSNVSGIFDAYPELEEFGVRGSVNLSFDGIRHGKLKKLVVESGGLSAATLESLWSAELPALEDLRLSLGTANYGGIDDVAPLEPLLSGELFPKLKTLGLCNSDIADAVATAVAGSEIVHRLEVLDLSEGNLTDAGARALLDSPAVRRVRAIDLSHHYLGDEMMAEIAATGREIDVSDQLEPETYGDEVYRYNAHSE